MVFYRYSPFPEPGYIRLVTIHPGNFNDKIVISFCTSTFPNDTLQYEALSYVWGPKRRRTRVNVSEDDSATTNGLRNIFKSKFTHIWITRNLDVALRHLRYAREPRVMWIDALCINQADEIEKGPQVAMMSEIYQSARRVVAWLGPEENDSDQAMHLVDYVGSELELDAATWDLRPAEGCKDPSICDYHISLPFNDRDLHAICHLMFREWFERLWIRQEIYLAGSDAVIMCGFCQVQWSIFRRGLICLSRKRCPWFDLFSQYAERFGFLSGFIFQNPITFLFNLRQLYGNSRCLDPRDRLYATRALFGDSEKALIPPPDYTQPYDKLYTIVVRNWIESYNNLDILRECQLQQSPCPSWVPDWSLPPGQLISSHLERASAQLRGWFEFPQPNVLRVMSISKCAVIKSHQVPPLAYYGKPPEASAVQKLRTLLLGIDAEEHHTAEEYARVLTAERAADISVPPASHFINLEPIKQFVERIMTIHEINDEDFWTLDAVEFRIAVSFAGGSHLLQCTNGYLGLVLEPARPGDEIHVVLGCRCPLLLRPQGNKRYQVVCACYVLGLMAGEAILGPLPNGIRAIQNRNEKLGTSYFPAFQDISSGEIFYEDPRLETLPVDLEDFRKRLREHPGARVTIGPDTLKQHGVDLKCIDLV
ncbi:HET-domain-containing protein [Daldinia sp. FL1419]|nr:HET-domain-containing protein [Daldinia sp. FL1419]